MTDMQNFIELPVSPLTFSARMRASARTVWAFLLDQKWTSLAFFLAYVAVMIWDFWYAKRIELNVDDSRWKFFPSILEPLKQDFAHSSQGTWRAAVANLITLLYWGNALLYVADRSEAFKKHHVVGLARYLLRGTGILLLLIVPLLIGFGLLVLPGLLVLSTLIAGATITLFQEQSTLRAIGTGFRLSTQSLPGQSRILGFSRSIFHIVGGYALVLLATIVFITISVLFFVGLQHLFPSQDLVFEYTQTILSNLFSSYLSLLFSIFVLRLYAEHANLLPADSRSEHA